VRRLGRAPGRTIYRQSTIDAPGREHQSAVRKVRARE
jgi:hypothetical protein